MNMWSHLMTPWFSRVLVKLASYSSAARSGAPDNEERRMETMDTYMIDHMELLLSKAHEDPNSTEGRIALAEALSCWRAFAAAFREGVARGQALPADKRAAITRMAEDLGVYE